MRGVPEAVKKLGKLREQGFAFTLDLLGEATLSEKEADEYAEGYMELLEGLLEWAGREGLPISIRLVKGADLLSLGEVAVDKPVPGNQPPTVSVSQERSGFLGSVMITFTATITTLPGAIAGA